MFVMIGLIGAAATLMCAESDVVFEERRGVVAVEAEHFFKQTHTDIRKWAPIQKV